MHSFFAHAAGAGEGGGTMGDCSSSAGAFEARASAGGYVLLAGPFGALGLLWTWLALHRPGSGSWSAVAVCAAAAGLWVVWLRGFRVRIAEGVLEYRDGLYRTRRCLLADIRHLEVAWVRCGLRLVVRTHRGAGALEINPKPFSRTDLAGLRQLLKGDE